jgi:hypothetical protein
MKIMITNFDDQVGFHCRISQVKKKTKTVGAIGKKAWRTAAPNSSPMRKSIRQAARHCVARG